MSLCRDMSPFRKGDTPPVPMRAVIVDDTVLPTLLLSSQEAADREHASSAPACSHPAAPAPSTHPEG